MSRDPSGIYSYPDGTRGSPGTTVFSARYNTFIDDLAVTLNSKLPINMGGTNANSADAALKNLSAEKATQLVTDYNTHVWFPGSFRSDAAAPGAPNATSSFAGIAYINEPLENPPTNQNVVVEARDMDSAVKPGLLYTKQKTDGVWSAWNYSGSGDDQTAARSAIYAAPFDAMAYNGMQINGGMEVSQENGIAQVTLPSGTLQKYVVDGWQVAKTGTSVLAAYQLLGNTDFQYPAALQLHTTTAQTTIGSDYVRFVTALEGWRIARAGWGTVLAQPITVSFWMRANLPGNYRAIAYNLGGSTATPWVTFNIPEATIWKWTTITFPAQTTGTWNSTNTIGMNIAIEVASNSVPNTAGFLGYYAAITGVYVHPGTQAPTAAQSPLIMRPYDQELVTCQRYWESSYPTGWTPGMFVGGNGSLITMAAAAKAIKLTAAGAGNRAHGAMPFAVEKRVTPTVTYWCYGSTPNAFTGFDINGSASINSLTSDSFRGFSATSGGISASNSVPGYYFYAAMWVADSRL